MSKLGRHWGAVWIRVLFVAALIGRLASEAPASQFVRLDYNLSLQNRSRNTVFIELFDDRPLTRDNFLQYVNGGHYDGVLMHRLAYNFVLQGGGFYPETLAEPPPLNVSLDPSAMVDLDGNPTTANPTVKNEFTNSPFRSNLRGTLAMAKVGGNPDSATNQFFFNLANNSANLDNQNGGFAVFAQVVGDGMTLIDAFGGVAVQNLNPDLNNDGTRDSIYSFAEVPVAGGSLVIVDDAERVNYYGAGSTTNVPAGGLVLNSLDSYIDTGAMFTGTGTITNGAGRTLGIREGVTLSRPLVNQGTLAPGLQLGSINLNTFQQTAMGKLEIQLRTTDPATPDSQEMDSLNVTGLAQLGGTLDVSLLAGFQPTAGQAFNILSAGSIGGAFSAVNLPMLNAGLAWQFDQLANSIQLSVVAPDYNKDGLVNGADLTVWKSTFGQTAANLAADGNRDGSVNGADLLIWQRQLGKNVGVATIAAIPEPAAATLVLAALAMLVRRRRR